MTAQMTLTAIILFITSSFVVCFFVDLFTTVRRAWKDTAPKIKNSSDVNQQSHKIINSNQIEPIVQPTYASLDWVKPQEIQAETEVINIIEIALNRSLSHKPNIETLPQTSYAKQLQESYSTPRPEYSTLAAMNVKKLRQEAKVWGVKNGGSLTKEKLIKAILAA